MAFASSLELGSVAGAAVVIAATLTLTASEKDKFFFLSCAGPSEAASAPEPKKHETPLAHLGRRRVFVRPTGLGA